MTCVDVSRFWIVSSVSPRLSYLGRGRTSKIGKLVVDGTDA